MYSSANEEDASIDLTEKKLILIFNVSVEVKVLQNLVSASTDCIMFSYVDKYLDYIF